MFSKIVVAAFAAVVGTASAGIENVEGYTYEMYLAEFGKSYERSEVSARQAIFDANVAVIAAHNADATQTWKKGINKFTDMSDEEFNKYYLNSYKGQGSLEGKRMHVRSNRPMALNVDWRR
jgi:hypothetical protein